ncbi:MAG: ABC transporter permease [Terracidiphilus sp.]
MQAFSRTLAHFASDSRYALRLDRRNPAFVLLTCLSLALAIGANTAVFSVAMQLLYQRLAVPHPEQLRLLGWSADASVVRFSYGTNFDVRDAGMTCECFSYPVFRQLREHDRSMSGLFAFWDRPATASIAGTPQPVRVELVSDNYYQILGVRPQLGSPILAANSKPGADAVAVISDGLWQRQFGRSPSVLGQSITVNHAPLTIVGVNPPGFTGTRSALQSPDLFVPLSMQPLIDPFIPEAPSILSDPTVWELDVMGRIPPGKDQQQARSALNVELAAAVRSSLPVRPFESVPQLVLVDGARGLHLWDQTFKKPVSALLVLVVLVLLLACANTANLMLARGLGRRREFAVRVALGASRARVVRQLLTESLVLAVIGGSLGLLLGFLGRNLLPHLLASNGQQSALRIHFDWNIFAFTAALTILSGLLFGLAPAFFAAFTEARGSLQRAAANSSGSWTRGGKALVVLQIALSALLVMGAGLFVRTLADLNSIDVGFPTGHLLLATIDTPREVYPGVKSILLHQRLQQTIAALPGVQAATSMDSSYFTGDTSRTTFVTEQDIAHPGHAEDELVNTVGDGFFSAMGVPIVAGRAFSPADNATSPPAAIVNQTLAKTRFPGQNPVGKRFTFSYKPGEKDWIEIVGVARDTKYQDLRETPPPLYFLPLAQGGTIYDMTYAIRSRLDPAVLIPELRRAVASVDPNLPIADIGTQQKQIDENMSAERALADLTSGFGALALALAIVGIYGVMLCSVEQRRKDIGIRLALGAQRRQVRNTILRESAWLALAGISVGLAATQAFTRVLASILYGISPRDPLVLSAVAALLLLVALAAAWIPARRAASVEPMEVLRHE